MFRSAADWADLMVLFLDLVEGIITTIHFDEDQFGMWSLALFWIGWAFVHDTFKHVASKCTECEWDDCLVVCTFEGGQCCLYILFCHQDAGMMWPLIILAIVQIVVKFTATVFLECQSQDEKTRIKQDKDQETKSNLIKCMRGPCGPVILSLLNLPLLLLQAESPFRAKWYEVALCVVLWLRQFMREIHGKASEESEDFVKRVQRTHGVLVEMSWQVLNYVLSWSWGLSPDLTGTFDRIVTVTGIVTGILSCCFCCLICFRAVFSSGEEGVEAEPQTVGSPEPPEPPEPAEDLSEVQWEIL